MRSLLLGLLIAAVICIIGSPIHAQVIQKVGEGEVNWELGVIRVKGIGAPPAQGANAAQKRVMALRAAQADGYRNLLEVTKGVRVSSTSTVKNYMANDVIRTKVYGLVKGAKIVNKEYMSDGSVEVTMEMPIYGTKGLSTAIFAANKEKFGTKKNTAPPPPLPTPQIDRKKQEELEKARQARLKAEQEAEEARKRAQAQADAERRAEEKRRKLEEERQRKERERALQRRREEEERKALEEERKRLEEEKRKKEQARLEAEQRLKEAQEAARKAREEEEKRKAQEAARKAREEAERLALEKKKAEEEARKAALAEEQRKAALEAKRLEEEREKKRKEEEMKRLEEEKRKAEEARKKAQQEAERKAREAAERKKREEEARKAAEAAKPQTIQIDEASLKGYTGVIVDSRGTGAKPAMSPKLLVLPPPPPEKEVYSMAEADYQVALNVGLVGYASSLDSARKRPRVGNNPMVVKATKTKSGKPSDISVPYGEGQKIIILNQKNKVLEQCKVVMVLGK